jgi:hypothetical protein
MHLTHSWVNPHPHPLICWGLRRSNYGVIDQDSGGVKLFPENQAGGYKSIRQLIKVARYNEWQLVWLLWLCEEISHLI